MPKDYAYRDKQKPRKPKRNVSYKSRNDDDHFPLKSTLFLIIMVAIFGWIMYQIFLLHSQGKLSFTPAFQPSVNKTITNQNALQTQKIITQNIQAKKQEPIKNLKEEKKIKFEFYTMLPKMQVAIQSDGSASSDNSTKFVLQLGTFKQLDKALEFQDKIKGYDYSTSLITIRRGKSVYYRVEIGPLKDWKSASKWHDKLAKKNVKSIIVTVVNK